MLKSKGRTGTRFLLEAMSQDKVHLARFVLDALDGEIVDSQIEGARTPLISSVLLPDDDRARCRFVELLLQRGASVNGQDPAGRTALSHACEKGHLDAAKLLVRHGADPELADSRGNTALMYAAAAGHSAVLEFLVRAFKRLGLQIDRQNKAGHSAAEVAKFLGHTRCLSALTHNTKRNRDAQENAETRPTLGNERKIEYLVTELELLQTCNYVRPSMDSIEEFEGENKSSSASPQDQILSVFPHPTPNTQYPKTGERLTTADDRLLPLLPSSNNHKLGAHSALDPLLTPICANKCDDELGAEKAKLLDLGERTFDASYYRKRCSLPAGIFSPTPPERTLAPLRKSRTVRRREASRGNAEPPSTAISAAPSAFSVLSNKLLRRFTSPTFKRAARDPDKDPEFVPGRIPRSETFPQAVKHPQVDSKASIDSISSVKCEFDFHIQKTNL